LIKRSIFLVLVIFFYSFHLFSEEIPDSSDESSFDKFLKRLTDGRKLTKNQPTLEFTYGFSNLSFAGDLLKNKFANAYTSEILYGFSRRNDRLNIKDIFYISQEFGFLRNTSSHFIFKTVKNPGITTDAWIFGFGINSGYGYKMGKSALTLCHGGAFVWSRVDVEFYTNEKSDNERLALYDEEFRFGTLWNGSIKFQIVEPVSLSLGYEHQLVFPRHLFGQWLVSWLIENASQRWLDFFEDDFLLEYKQNWPWMNFLIKNAISLGLYELRRKNMNWPYNTASPLNYDCLKLGVNFIF
jgi:hypothetical protein